MSFNIYVYPIVILESKASPVLPSYNVAFPSSLTRRLPSRLGFTFLKISWISSSSAPSKTGVEIRVPGFAPLAALVEPLYSDQP